MNLDRLTKGRHGWRSNLPPEQRKGPQWSFVDLASKWGLTPHELRWLIMKNPGFPAVTSLQKRACYGPSAQYYDLHSAEKWMQSIKDAVIADIEERKKELAKHVA